MYYASAIVFFFIECTEKLTKVIYELTLLIYFCTEKNNLGFNSTSIFITIFVCFLVVCRNKHSNNIAAFRLLPILCYLQKIDSKIILVRSKHRCNDNNISIKGRTVINMLYNI